MPRTETINEQTVKAIEQAFAQPNATRARVAEAAGLARSTLFLWLQRGRTSPGSPLYRRVAEAGQSKRRKRS